MDGELSELDWISFYENTREIEETYSRWYGYFFYYWEGHSTENSKNMC